jgi:hypothetical protein
MENPFKWRHFQPEIILLTVRWYLRYSLSYRDLEEMMAERGLSVDRTTIYRWVQEYAPEIDKRSRPYLDYSRRGHRCPHRCSRTVHEIFHFTPLLSSPALVMSTLTSKA